MSRPRKYSYYDNYYYESSRPRKADGGMRTSAKRGEIGSRWWSKQFLSALETFGWTNRLERGKRYARSGQVLGISICKGEVTAKVQGSQVRPYSVKINYPSASEKSWTGIIARMKGKPELLSRILIGDVPEELERIFREEKSSLFPSRAKEIEMECSCPDYANPCKHIAAVFYVMADTFDQDPFLLLQLKGRSRSEIMNALSTDEGKKNPDASYPPPGGEASPDHVRSFWSGPTPLVEAHTRYSVVPALRKYPLPSDMDDPTIIGILDTYYREIVEGAGKLIHEKLKS